MVFTAGEAVTGTGMVVTAEVVEAVDRVVAVVVAAEAAPFAVGETPEIWRTDLKSNGDGYVRLLFQSARLSGIDRRVGDCDPVVAVSYRLALATAIASLGRQSRNVPASVRLPRV